MQSDQESRKPDDRRAYLVRLWRAAPEQPWRASVRPVAADAELHFSSPEELFLYLHNQMTQHG
jgi:hypothetical protein